MKKLIPLKGEGRRVVRLSEGARTTEAVVSPVIGGRLWLCAEDGGLAHGELCEGACTVSGGEFIGAVITRGGTVTHVGGFAGRGALQGRATAEIRMRAQQGAQRLEERGSAKRAEPEKTQREPEKRPEETAAERAQEPQAQKKAQQQRAEEKPRGTAEREPREGARQKSAALLEILQKAQELFLPLAEAQQTEERGGEERMLNPFPQAFPFSRWRRVEYPGTDSYYLEGETVKNGVTYAIYALPGEYRSRPRAKGFDKFLRSRDGSGYWVRVTNAAAKQ